MLLRRRFVRYDLLGHGDGAALWLPYIAVIGNNSAMNQIRCGQIGKYGPERGCIGNKLGDVDFEKFAECFGGWGNAVREPGQIRPALEKARERVAGGNARSSTSGSISVSTRRAPRPRRCTNEAVLQSSNQK